MISNLFPLIQEDCMVARAVVVDMQDSLGLAGTPRYLTTLTGSAVSWT